jgi:predicted lipid-binding transport protein (Tim44 family)
MFRRLARLAAAALVVTMMVAPDLAMARAGGGSSFGSRGARTYSAPPRTGTAPGVAAPMERSVAPQAAPRPSPGFGAAAPASSGFFGRSPFMSGLMGGLIGAGIGGLLFGHGMFGGMHGFAGFLGFLLQIFLVVIVVRLIWSFFAARRQQQAMAGGPSMLAREAEYGPLNQGGGYGAPAGGQVAIGPDDYHAFEDVLHRVQAAWSGHDLSAMRQVASPEMVSYFAEQMAEQASRGVRNVVSDVRLEQGDLAEAWSEPGREYATVAMRFSMTDVTRDGAGRVVDGDAALRTQATELWTFLRAPGGRWVLSAIQQAR